MRIVSQDRNNDINYDITHIGYQKENDKHIIYAIIQCFENRDKWCELGIYESKERCIEVMESIRNSYIHDSKVFLMPEE